MIYPSVIVSEQGQEFLEKGQMWMYRNNLLSADENAKDGEPVSVFSEDGKFIASGFYSEVSHVAVRILTRNEADTIDRAFFEKRIHDAVSFRRVVERDNMTCARKIFSEADLLPGLIADRYNDILVTQISCTGFEKRKDMIYELLKEEFAQEEIPVRYIYERNDIAPRLKEGLEQYQGFHGEEGIAKTVISENGLKLNVDIENGQKTGYFLDQKSNRVLIRNLSKGLRVLDCFTHTGGFALNAALGGAKEVTAVDVSQTALDQGLENAKLNHLEGRMKFVQADVFEYLDEIQPDQFDLIILDPPAFTKSRKTFHNAKGGYKQINKEAMRLLGRGGYLASASCSHFMPVGEFRNMLSEAAFEAGVSIRIIEERHASMDHPVLPDVPETEYLKFFVVQII
jgi:23S rRNA (cytosine1962-C5)-methyltransferase